MAPGSSFKKVDLRSGTYLYKITKIISSENGKSKSLLFNMPVSIFAIPGRKRLINETSLFPKTRSRSEAIVVVN